MMQDPAGCRNMDELRAVIDALDAELVALLARRAACIDRAAQIKHGAGLPARIGPRVAEVIGNVRAHAAGAGLDPALVQGLWEQLIEWSIAREEVQLGPGAGPAAAPGATAAGAMAGGAMAGGAAGEAAGEAAPHPPTLHPPTLHGAMIRWQAGVAPAEIARGRYGRAHSWHFDGGAVVAASAAPAVVAPPFSDPAAVDPEEAFVAALAACHMLWFLDLARRAGHVALCYEDAARGEMGPGPDGRLAILRLRLCPRTDWSAQGPAGIPDDAAVAALHRAAHAACFLAASVRCEIVIAPQPAPAPAAEAEAAAAAAAAAAENGRDGSATA